MAHIGSYSSIYNLGHAAISGIFDHPVTVEEKVDGSQWSMGVIGGELTMRSKGADVRSGDGGMFAKAIETAERLAPDMVEGWVYRGEFLGKPKHNTLAYDRTPAQHVVIFDIDTADQTYMAHREKASEAERLGLEVVPLLHEGVVGSVEQVHAMLETPSFLGGQKIEGVVVKSYGQFTADKKVAMGKHVSEVFKETHRGDWKTRNPGRADVVEALVATYRTPARWRKAVQHMAESGTLLNAPQDIGPLLKEIGADVMKEERDEIAGVLFAHFWPQIQRGITAGAAQWYKDELLASAFSA